MARSCAMMSMVWAAFCMAVVSVTSSRRLCGRRPVSERIRAMSSTTAGDTNCRCEMFTPTARSAMDGSSSCHFRSWRQALVSTIRPSGTMSPVSSAMEMNASGITSPLVG